MSHDPSTSLVLPNTKEVVLADVHTLETTRRADMRAARVLENAKTSFWRSVHYFFSLSDDEIKGFLKNPQKAEPFLSLAIQRAEASNRFEHFMTGTVNVGLIALTALGWHLTSLVHMTSPSSPWLLILCLGSVTVISACAGAVSLWLTIGNFIISLYDSPRDFFVSRAFLTNAKQLQREGKLKQLSAELLKSE